MTCARELVWEYRSRFGILRGESQEDLLQECLLQWYLARARYDQTKPANRKTYMRRIIENKLIDVVTYLSRQKRNAGKTISVEDLDMEDESPSGLWVEDLNFEEAIKSDVVEIVKRAMADLSGRQKELCRLILEEAMSMNQISKKLQIPRGSLFDEVLRIREVFSRAGLKDYI